MTTPFNEACNLADLRSAAHRYGSSDALHGLATSESYGTGVEQSWAMYKPVALFHPIAVQLDAYREFTVAYLQGVVEGEQQRKNMLRGKFSQPDPLDRPRSDISRLAETFQLYDTPMEVDHIRLAV